MVRTRSWLTAGAVVGAVSMLAAWTPGTAGATTPRAQAATMSPGLAPLTGSAAAELSRDVTSAVVVVLRDQHAELPDTASLATSRAAAVSGDQGPILADLHLTAARNIKTFTLINAVSATVSPGEAARLAADPAVAEVVPDAVVNAGRPALGAGSATPTGPRISPSGQQICAPAGHVQLNPEAVEVIHAASDNPAMPTAHRLGFTGTGVTVGWIADGIDIHNPDFTRNGKSIFSDYKDFTGDGTSAATSGGEAFLDASSIAAQGNTVYNIGGATPCLIRIEGVAPGARLVGLRHSR